MTSKDDSNKMLKVLLVESNELTISSIRQMFSEIKECRLETARSYGEVLEKISEWEPDLILLSHALSGESGQETVDRIYQKYPNTFVIVFLPAEEESVVAEYIQAGVNGFVVIDKNFISALMPAVKKALIRIVEKKAFLLPSLSNTTFSLEDDDLLHLSAFHPGDTVLHYRILEEIAEGGMGQVYRAEDQILRRQVALKVLPRKVTKSEKARKRMLREARLAASLNHPNICSIYEIGEKDGHTFIAMEYVHGSTLQKRIESGPMEVDEVVRIGIQIADALKEAHKQKIVHRDIKSLNIILTDRKQVKVLDFGLAKKLLDLGDTNAPVSSQITETGEVVGTLHFMSPEQALGKPMDYRSDIFQFGVVLYHMLTGTTPFAGNSIAEVMDCIINRDPVPIARLNNKTPDRLIRLVQTMMNKDPWQRCETLEQVWLELRKIQKEILIKKPRLKHSTPLKELWQSNQPGKPDDPAS